MKACIRLRYGVAAVLLSSAVLVLAPTPVRAAGADWRPIYDIVMMWVNFVILAAVLVKVLGKPLGGYLRERRDAVKETMTTLDSEKERIETQIRSLQQDLENRKQRAAELHRRIVDQGQAERGEVIAAAQAEAERRLDKARLHIEARQREAWQKLRNEIIDTAVHKARAELPRHVSPELEQSLLEQYLKSISDPHR